jgi:hypothetical protein
MGGRGAKGLAVAAAALAFVLAAGVRAHASQSKGAGSLEVVNVMPAFWEFWERSRDADEATKVRLFRELVIEPRRPVFDGFTGPHGDEEIALYLKKVRPLLPRMRALGDNFLADFEKHRRSFGAAFPDVRWDVTVCFMPNFGVTDAGTGVIDGKSYLVFGIDTIAAQQGDGANLATLFHHELFHVYHAQRHPEWRAKSRSKGEVPLYWLLWSEGLATYVSQTLNPQATPEQVLLSKTLEREAAPLLPALAKDLRENLTSTSTAYLFDYLSSSPRRKEIPPRAGYYVGLLVARELARARKPAGLARLGGEELLREMREALLAIEKRGKA